MIDTADRGLRGAGKERGSQRKILLVNREAGRLTSLGIAAIASSASSGSPLPDEACCLSDYSETGLR